MTRSTLWSISVVIPAFNAGPYLAATLQSVLEQGTEGVQVVLVDGGSTDNTLAVARAFIGLQVTIVSENDNGQLDALQKGLKLASGDILLWLNADDVVMPGAFSLVRKTFARYDPDFVYSDDVAFDELGQGYYYGPPIRGLNDLDHFLFYRQMYSECVYWKRSATKFLPHTDYDLRVYTDYAFFLRMRWGRRGHWVPKRLGAFRIREGQASAEFSTQKEQEYTRIKADHRAHIGMSEITFTAARVAYWPWFAARQQLMPNLRRGARRLARIASRDRIRRREARWFFEHWLLPLNSKGPR